MNILVESFANQFENNWNMLEQAIRNVPDEFFIEKIKDFRYNLKTYHIIEVIDYYMNYTPDTMSFGEFAGIDWDNDEEEKIEEKIESIDKEMLTTYLEQVKKDVNDELKGMQDARLMYQDEFDRFNSIHEKIIYVLRHTTLHIGELAKSLREWGVTRIEWE